MQARVPAYIVVGRIVAVVGMSLAIALSIFFLLGGLLLWGVVAAVAAAPFFAMIFLIERAPGGTTGKDVKSAREMG